MRWHAPALVVITVACGRIDFNAEPVDDACAAGSCGAVFPVEGGACTSAEQGPFAEAGLFPTQGGGYGVFVAPPYVLMADTTGGLHDLRFDGSTFTEVGALSSLGWVEDVWYDGTYYYVASPGYGLWVIDVAPDGSLEVRTSNTAALAQARRGWVSQNVLYLPNGGSGMYAVDYDGVSLTLVGTPTPSMSWSQGAWANGTRVMLADNAALRVLDFDGSAFDDVVAPDTSHGGSTRVWSDGTTYFVANGDGASAFEIDGSTLIELDTFPIAGGARDIWSDGQHLFVGGNSDGVYALTFSNDHFAMIDHADLGGIVLGVIGDGTYVYVNDHDAGLYAYAGFRCTSW